MFYAWVQLCKSRVNSQVHALALAAAGIDSFLAGSIHSIRVHGNIFQKHIIQGLSGSDHWQTGRALDAHMEDNRFIGLVEQEFAHFGVQILHAITVNSLDAIRVGQGHVIRVLGVSYGNETILVEKALPVFHHHLSVIIQNHEFNGDFLFGDSFEFRACHVEGSITIHGNAAFRGVCKFCANTVSHGNSHSSQRTTTEHLSRLSPRDELGGNHLVNAYSSCKDGVVDHT
mmetsp:Transcript_26344/g.55050  ORF Transcript_26344/g.55050 Transcript_26344/m.55050 type:complete len:229 (-) Transcript_26344:193-879(-)